MTTKEIDQIINIDNLTKEEITLINSQGRIYDVCIKLVKIALSTEHEEVLRLKIMCHKIDKERAKAQIELEQLKTQ